MGLSATSDVKLHQVTRDAQGIVVTWVEGGKAMFHTLWLRDNCRCEACGDPTIGRRNLRLTGIPTDLALTHAEISPAGDLSLNWSDGHASQFAADWLRRHAYDDDARRNRAFVPSLWSDTTRANPPSLSFAAVHDDPATFFQWLCHLRDTGLCFLRGAVAEPGILEALARRVGPVQESNFGLVQDLVVDPRKRSVAHAEIALKPHTDEPYRASPPGLLMFHCIDTDAAGGGSSLFLDGFELAEILRAEDPEGFAALANHNHAFRRHFKDDVDLITAFPIISTDEFGNLTGIRVNDRVAAPLAIPPDAVPVYYRGLRRLLELAEDPARMIHLSLRPGDIVTFDNHRILHGRTALAIKGRRWLQWAQVERGDFHSALRITADRLGQPRDASPLLRGAYG